METNKASYTLLSKDSINLYIDSLGYENIPDNAVELLCEDVNYQLRSIIQKSYDFMRLTKRRKLVVEDVNKSLDISNVKPLFGHSSNEPPQFHEIKPNELFVYADETIDLNVILEERTHLHIQPNPTPNISSCWVNVSPIRKTDISNIDLINNCETYLQFVKDSIENCNTELFQEICLDIKSNPNLAIILTHLLVYMQKEIEVCKDSILKTSFLLRLVESILENQYIFLDTQPNLKLIMLITSRCLVLDLDSSKPVDNMDAYVLIHRGAYLVFNIIRNWANTSNNIQCELESELNFKLHSEATTLTSLYAVLLSFYHLGYNPVINYIFPRLNNILEKIENVLTCPTSPYNVKLQANQVRGLLLAIFEIFLRHSLRSKSNQSMISSLVYATLYDTYSDALSTRIPIVHTRVHPGNTRRHEEQSVAMKIKTSVQESATGIKLTILTKPKNNLVSARQRDEKNKPRLKLKLADVFDVVNVHSRKDALFILKLRGRQHLCTFTERRKAQILARNMTAQHAVVSRYRSLSAKMNHITKGKKMSRCDKLLPFDFSSLVL